MSILINFELIIILIILIIIISFQKDFTENLVLIGILNLS